jgi:hypothetical protein
MINRVPQPPLLAFAPHKAPHFIHLGGINLPQDNVNLRRIKRVEQSFIGSVTNSYANMLF